jgi:Ran GTPase-activating protein (RanGAP) involved in mRNA processing and transport
MKKFEQENNIKIKYAETEVINNKKLMDKLMINESDLSSKVVHNEDIIKKEKEVFIEPKYKKCSCYDKVVYEKAILDCGHCVCKNCLIQSVLRSFLKEKPYEYSCSNHKLQYLILDCGCIWTKFGERIGSKANINNYGECNKQHKLNSIDCCLINDFISFPFVYLMIFDYLTELKEQIYNTNEAIWQSDIKNIECMLKSTKAITCLDLSYKGLSEEKVKSILNQLKINNTLTRLYLNENKIGIEGGKTIGEALKVNTTLTTLNLCNSNIGVEGGKAISEGLKVNTTLTILNLNNNNIGVEGRKMVDEIEKKRGNLEIKY